MRNILVLVGLLSATTQAQDLYDINRIRTIEITVQSDWRTVMAANFKSRTLIKADIRVDGVLYKDVGVRHRGISTYYFLPPGKLDKRPWKVAVDEFVPGQRIHGYRTLNFGNNVWDPSMVREVAGYEFMRRFIPTPKSCFAKLVVNGEDLGIFANTQQINKDFLRKHFDDTEGNRYRGERASTSTPWNDTALTWLGTQVARYKAAYELKTENGNHAPWTTLIASINTLNNTPNAQLEHEVPKALAVDHSLRFLALANLTVWLDGYIGRTCKNFYIYEDHHHGQLNLLPWDLNNGFAGITDGRGGAGAARLSPFFHENNSQYPRPVFGQLVKVPKWRAAYLAHLRAMLEEFDGRKMIPRLNALRAFLRPALLADNKRIYTMQEFDDAMTKTIDVGFLKVPPLAPFFRDRTSYLGSHPDINRTAPAIRALTHSPTAPLPTEAVWINVTITGATIKDATLHYRTRGPFVSTILFDDGGHRDGAAGDGVYGARIPPQPAFTQVEFYASANTDLARTGAMTIFPSGGSYRAHAYRVRRGPTTGPIVISEFLAKNDTGLRDPSGERDDWIELANIGATPVTVGGMYVTDDVNEPTKWQIPAGQSLAPGSQLIIWADDQPAQGPLHATFKLAAGGEEIALFAADGKTNLDWLGFGPQIADVSMGRLPGHLKTAFRFLQPTPTLPNQAAPCGHLPYASSTGPTGFALTGSGLPKAGFSVQYAIAQAPATASGTLYIGLDPTSLALPSLGALLIGPGVILPLATFQASAGGAATVTFTFPNDPALAGKSLYLQAFAVTRGQGRLSNASALRTCK